MGVRQLSTQGALLLETGTLDSDLGWLDLILQTFKLMFYLFQLFFLLFATCWLLATFLGLAPMTLVLVLVLAAGFWIPMAVFLFPVLVIPVVSPSCMVVIPFFLGIIFPDALLMTFGYFGRVPDPRILLDWSVPPPIGEGAITFTF
jgi:hypothetical protein